MVKKKIKQDVGIINCRNSPKWKPDPKGYFIIRLVRDEKKIGIRHYTYKNEPTIEFHGKKASHIYEEIIKRKLISTLDHAAYIGKELMKAECALKNNKRYVQI